MTRALHWFRNDLRLADNTGLRAAARGADALALLYVLDDELLASPRIGAPRVHFLLRCLERLDEDLRERGQHLIVRTGRSATVVPAVVRELGVERVTWNEDTSPFARRRDGEVRSLLEGLDVRVETFRDRVVFSAGQILTKAGTPFARFTPFRNAWWRRFREEDECPPARAPRLPKALAPVPRSARWPAPEDLGHALEGVELPTAGEAAARRRLQSFLDQRVARYAEDRDRMDLDGTSRLSPYLRFGALSPRQCIRAALDAAADDPRRRKGVGKWVDELIWREFYAAILETHPQVLHHSFQPQYDRLRWRHDEEEFAAWCEGRTGFPVVDAGMRQLRATGWMHNRARMIVASFLTKDLLLSWRWGERHFEQWLVDADPASNNGGWQWSASTGTDAQPYFRIFNPIAQGRRFDPDGDYVRRWVPELAELGPEEIHEPWRLDRPPDDYPPPLVDHASRRALALARFEAARGD